nr:DNA helicase [Tanacetum cinerariifolium]
MRNFKGREEATLNPDNVERLIHLYNKGGARGYELPNSDVLGGIVFEDGPNSRTDFDAIIEFRGVLPQRINELHQSYMSLQFPLLFVFGEPGYYPELLLKPRNGRGRGQKVTMNAYYEYQLHLRVKGFGFIFKGGRLFQQYVVAAFCAIEQSLLDFIRKRQRELRSDYLLGLYDTISQGAREGIQVGSMFLGLTPGDRADIVCRVFEQKVNDFLGFLKDKRPFGYVIAFLHTIEFQKRGLPHCHTLLWVDSSNKIKEATQIDDYISAELPDPVDDPIAYKVVTELMMHGPCGVVNPSEVCTEKVIYNKGFSKMYNEKTLFDINGHTHYRRRQTRVHFMKGGAREPVVQILNVHLENMQRGNFKEIDRLDVIVNMPDKKKKTTLNEWYVYNNEHTDGMHLIYLDFSSEFVWHADSKSWHRREIRTKKSIGRLAYVHPNSGDLFYFRMLMSHQKGCRSPIEEKHWEAMKDDIPGKVSDATGILNYFLNTPELQGHILYELEATLNGFRKSVEEFGLPTPPEHLLKDLKNKLLIKEKNYRRDVLLQETLRDLMNAPEAVFGGKAVILEGDFRQTLPVKKGAVKQDLIHASIAESYLWSHFKVCMLKQNMRLMRSDLSDEERERSKLFAQWLLEAGNGEIGCPDKDNDKDTFWITVAQEYCISPSEQALSQLINFIYDDATLKTPTANAFQEKA